MAKIVARIRWSKRSLFWEILPDIFPDLKIHMPALTSAVRDVIREDKDKGDWNWWTLHCLSSHPLPTISSPESMNWRQELVDTWEEELKWARETLDGQDRKKWNWERRYISSLRGLTQVDRCDLAQGMTCPSVLPTLLGEAHAQRFKAFEQLNQLECLAILSGWRPGLNVLTDPTVLNEWESFWLELYQQGDMDVGEEKPDIQIIKKGIAAKALLNLTETGRKEGTAIPTGLETTLLNSLTIAIYVAGESEDNSCQLDWLRWHPRDVIRFPTDRLAKLPKTLLKTFTLSCQNSDESRYEKLRRIRRDSLTDLVRWHRTGLPAACSIDLLPAIVTAMSNYLNKFRGAHHFRSEYLLNHELCRWLVQEEVANVEGGRELLRNLENHWRSECHSEYSGTHCQNIAWYGRIQLQRAGLATEPPSTFQEDLLETIKNEKSEEVRLVLSLWRPGEDTPDRVRRQWKRFWEKGLKSNSEAIFRTSAVALLRPDPHEDTIDPIARYQKLRATLWEAPKQRRPELSMTELMHLTGGPALENLNVTLHADANQKWQFRLEETRFRVPVPTEPAALVSTPATVQTVCPDRTIQRTHRHEQSHT